MSKLSILERTLRRRRLGTVLAVCGLVVLSAGHARAADGAAVGKNASTAGAVVVRQAGGKEWKTLAPDAVVHSGDLVVGLPGAALVAGKGAVRLSLVSDLGHLSPVPVIENAIVLHDAPGVDLDFTLDRGRVDVANARQQGPAKVRVHFRKEAWDLTLAEPGTAVALELYGRWPPGIPKDPKPQPNSAPDAECVLLVLKGQVDLKAGSTEYALHAPPGPALFQWDTTSGAAAGPRRLEKLPEWADPRAVGADAARVQAVRTALARIQKRLASEPVVTALTETLAANDPAERRAAVYCFGGLDLLDRVLDALSDARHADVRESAVLALRHWIGRAPGQEAKLHDLLVERHKLSPRQAEIVVQLLHSPDEQQRSRPELYETLIAGLQSRQLAIRELAYWHLSRLAPAGKKIGYDAAAPEAQRQAAVERWKKLIPEGKLPQSDK
jgi:hypothetical protein